MDLLKAVLADKGPELVAELTRAVGFSRDQAERFVPQAGSEVLGALAERPQDLDLENPTSAASIGAILKGIDVAGLASRVGISADQGEQGLATLAPMLLGLIAKSDAKGGLLSVLESAGGSSGALGKLRGLGGKLFG